MHFADRHAENYMNVPLTRCAVPPMPLLGSMQALTKMSCRHFYLQSSCKFACTRYSMSTRAGHAHTQGSAGNSELHTQQLLELHPHFEIQQDLIDLHALHALDKHGVQPPAPPPKRVCPNSKNISIFRNAEPWRPYDKNNYKQACPSVCKDNHVQTI